MKFGYCEHPPLMLKTLYLRFLIQMERLNTPFSTGALSRDLIQTTAWWFDYRKLSIIGYLTTERKWAKLAELPMKLYWLFLLKYVRACMCMFQCLHTCVLVVWKPGQPQVSSSGTVHLSFEIWSLNSLELVHFSRLARPKHLPACVSAELESLVWATKPGCLTHILGSKPRSSLLHNKYFTNWAISPVSNALHQNPSALELTLLVT